MEIAWMKRWEEKHGTEPETSEEIANMDRDDFTVLLEEIEHH